ncbi:MAG: RHS repeat-associated core domain-containing protein [Kiritimatiellia bacterium]|jgi:RHS repeat-associated protein
MAKRRERVGNPVRRRLSRAIDVRGFSYDYAYDPVGNRTSATEYDENGAPLFAEYAANELNQYTARTVPGYAAVRGEAGTNAFVTVNERPAFRLGEYLYGGDTADNTASNVLKDLEVYAAINPPGTNVPDTVYAATATVFVARTPEAFTYDADGNMTSDGRFAYTWNGENRMVMASNAEAVVTYAYDHQSRRIASATAVWTNGAWQAAESRAFLYDGWNVIRETVAVGSGSPQSVGTNLYTWGLDLSGTLQGAGGIGGLLAASLDGTSVLYGYDANGNVCQLVGTDGELLAHYEYSPFGEIIVSAGPLAKANPFRFSTKHWDNLTGLGYWGYRWYSPGMGRWMSRDPIGERGGLNLHVFLLNKVVNHIDALGQLSSTLPGYSKKDFSMKASGSKGLGGHISILIVRESAKHCCTSGQFYGQMKDIVEWTFGPEIGVHVGVNLTVQFAGVGVDVGFTGPGISLRLGNVTKTFDRCFPDDAFAHLELINLEIAPGIQNVAIGLGYLAKVEGRMKAWFDFQANVDVTPDGFDLNGGIFVDYDVSIKGYLGFEEFILLNIDTLAPDGKHQRIPLVEF